jgi:Protein of unknown function (DUF4013)
MSSSNPYAAQQPAQDFPGGPGPAAMEYMRAYHFIFENPNWTMTVLYMGLIALAAIIPGVGILLQLFYLGYQFLVLDALLQSRGTRYPDFEFGKIGDYLGRGIWPFLVNLVASVVFIPLIYIVLIVVGVLIAVAASIVGEDLAPVVATVGGLLAAIVFLGCMLALMLLMAPMILRAGLAQDFTAAFQFTWITDFIKTMYREMIFAGLFLMGTGLALTLLGALACGIGLFAVIPLLVLGQTHLLYQLYSIYLARGGTPVPVKIPAPLPNIKPQ